MTMMPWGNETLETSRGTTEQSTERFVVGKDFAQQDLLHMTISCWDIQASNYFKQAEVHYRHDGKTVQDSHYAGHDPRNFFGHDYR
jgi:hypothetical protein